MGNEALCHVDFAGRTAEAKVLLESEELLVRGALKLKIPFREMDQVAAAGGVLSFRWQGSEARVNVGTHAGKWAEKILHPRSVIDKLGVKEGQRVSIVGDVAAGLVAEIEERSGDVSRRLRKGSDVIFFGIAAREKLPRLAALRAALAPAGAVWVI